MNYADPWTAIYRNTNHAGNVIQVSLSEALCAIEWVNPDDHVLFKELAGELEKVIVGLGSCHPIHLLHLLQIAPVAMLVHIVVLDEHFLTDVVLSQFIGHDVGSLCRHLIFDFILFSYD